MTTPGDKPIGGFFELTLPKRSERFSTALAVNSGRNALAFFLKSSKAQRVYLPAYTCCCIHDPLVLGSTVSSFYNVDRYYFPENLPELEDGEYFLYVDYYGLCSDNVNKLISRYGKKLILDLSQSLFSQIQIDGIGGLIFSPRKFCGLPDGGLLYTDHPACHKDYNSLPVDHSSGRCLHLLKRYEQGPQAAYGDFKTNDASLTGLPVMQMSQLTRGLMNSVDFNEIADARHANFKCIHEGLACINEFVIRNPIDSPLAYPFRHSKAPEIREKLITRGIFIPKYWPCVETSTLTTALERVLADTTLPLPIDQRYGAGEMKFIMQQIRNNV